MSGNLPPGVTAQDIDDYYGGETTEFIVTLNVSIDIPARALDEEDAVANARDTVDNELDMSNGEVVHIEPEGVYPE